MIEVDAITYGRADEIAAALGPDVTVDMVRNWARRDGLPKCRHGGEVWYPLQQAAAIEEVKRRSQRGRPRRVDEVP